MVELFPLLIDVLKILFQLKLLLSALKSIREKKFTIKSPDLLRILEKLSISNRQLFFFFLQLKSPFLFINPSSF